MCGGRPESAGRSNRRASEGESDSRSSTEFIGISGLILEFWLWVGESFRFFVEDVLTMSCLCSSEFAVGSKVGGSAEKVRCHS